MCSERNEKPIEFKIANMSEYGKQHLRVQIARALRTFAPLIVLMPNAALRNTVLEDDDLGELARGDSPPYCLGTIKTGTYAKKAVAKWKAPERFDVIDARRAHGDAEMIAQAKTSKLKGENFESIMYHELYMNAIMRGVVSAPERKGSNWKDQLSERARILYEIGVSLTDHEGFSLMFIAAISGNVKSMDTLLSSKADPDKTRRSGAGPTPLAFAAKHVGADAVRFLLEAGANHKKPFESKKKKLVDFVKKSMCVADIIPKDE